MALAMSQTPLQVPTAALLDTQASKQLKEGIITTRRGIPITFGIFASFFELACLLQPSKPCGA